MYSQHVGLFFFFFLQCIPTPLSWFAHQLPEWLQKLSVVFTYVIEIVIPFLFFSPVRGQRLFAFYSEVCTIKPLSNEYNGRVRFRSDDRMFVK